jgi:hypothetical protein
MVRRSAVCDLVTLLLSPFLSSFANDHIILFFCSKIPYDLMPFFVSLRGDGFDGRDSPGAGGGA